MKEVAVNNVDWRKNQKVATITKFTSTKSTIITNNNNNNNNIVFFVKGGVLSRIMDCAKPAYSWPGNIKVVL